MNKPQSASELINFRKKTLIYFNSSMRAVNIMKLIGQKTTQPAQALCSCTREVAADELIGLVQVKKIPPNFGRIRRRFFVT